MIDSSVRIGMWSGPRNISTAMMRSFENRPDTVVVDEPFYSAYLARTGLDHPGREEVIASQPTAYAEVISRLLDPPGAPVQYVKHMTHHADAADDLLWARAFHNVLLIRDPREVVASYTRSREACEPADIGTVQQQRIWELLDQPPVIDAADFLADPEAYLRWLCDHAGIEFTDAMLHWPPGRRESDGVWAQHWYAAVEASTGFEPRAPREIRLDTHDAGVAEACRPAYEALRAQRIRLAEGV